MRVRCTLILKDSSERNQEDALLSWRMPVHIQVYAMVLYIPVHIQVYAMVWYLVFAAHVAMQRVIDVISMEMI